LPSRTGRLPVREITGRSRRKRVGYSMGFAAVQHGANENRTISKQPALKFPAH
jgi:hypothetical protein